MIRLDYSGVSKENIKDGLSFTNAKSPTRARNIKKIFEKKVSVMLDFLDIPETSEEELQYIESKGREIAKNNTDLVILGIGGSALGVTFLENTFVSSLNKKPKLKVTVCDNIDSESFLTFLDTLNLKKTAFNIISKSGGTNETVAQMLLVMERLRKKKVDFRKKFYVTATEGNSLWNFAESHGVPTFKIPVGVGGRFSILTPVGLLPAAAMDINIRGLLAGAKTARENGRLDDIKNLSYTTANINYHFLKKGMTNLVTMPYSDRLKYFPDFFAQLWAESLGKKYDREGKEVFAGQNPIKTLGVTDQHSQLQLYSEGPRDKVIMFLTVKNTTYDETIVEDYGLAKHMKGVTLKQLFDYEYSSTAYSLTTLDRPNYTLELDSITEESIGELIMLCELMTAYMGEFLNINTYDQPGVELSKVYIKACMNVKGYENEGRAIKNYTKSKKFLSL